LLLSFFGEPLRLGARCLTLGLDHLLLARLIVLAARLGFFLGGAQHLGLVSSAALGCCLALGGIGLFLGLRLRLGAHLRGFRFLVAL
jgi:hypothetical protein